MILIEEELHQTKSDLKNQSLLFPAIASFLMLLVATSTVFYHLIEGWNWLDSIYYVVVTMATVGYGDLTPSQPISKIYTIFLIIFGIATFAAFITQLFKRQGLQTVIKQLSDRQMPFEAAAQQARKTVTNSIHLKH